MLPCRAHAPARNPPFATLALGRAPRTRLPFVPRLSRLTPLPTRYPSHRPGRSAVRCRAVRSSSPSKRGEKAQLSTGKDGRGKTLFTSAVSPPTRRLVRAPPPGPRGLIQDAGDAHLSSLGKTWRRARAPPERTRAAPIERRDARVSPATHRRARSASDPRLPAPPPTRRADRPAPSERIRPNRPRARASPVADHARRSAKKKKKKNSRLRFWLDGRVREPRRPV